MSAPLSHESRELLRMLLTGQWFELAKIKAELAAKVPPGRALRTYETKAAYRNSRHGPRSKPELTDQEKIDSGRTSLVNNAVLSMSKRYVEIRGDDVGMVREIRLRPGVTLPGKVNAGTEAPPAGLAEAGTADATADGAAAPAELEEYTPDDVRALIAEAVQPIVDEAFEDLEVGLRGYLDHQFNAMDTLLRRALNLGKRESGTHQDRHERHERHERRH